PLPSTCFPSTTHFRSAVTPRHKGELDPEAMAAAASEVRGLHDFLPFCKPREGATTIRTLHELRVERDQDAVITIDLRADAFCHQDRKCTRLNSSHVSI